MVKVFRKIIWTSHSKIKMKQYGLSVSKLLNILRRPERKEKAIVPDLVAVMRTNKKIVKTPSLLKTSTTGPGNKWKPIKAPGEIWLMYKDAKSVKDGAIRKIISAWRYPGITKPGEDIPIPDDILLELKQNNY